MIDKEFITHPVTFNTRVRIKMNGVEEICRIAGVDWERGMILVYSNKEFTPNNKSIEEVRYEFCEYIKQDIKGEIK